MSNNGSAEPFVDRDVQEVTERVQKYTETDTTDELYDFGKLLLQEGIDRAHWIDAKASTLAGFNGALVAFLLYFINLEDVFGSGTKWTAYRSAARSCVYFDLRRVCIFGVVQSHFSLD